MAESDLLRSDVFHRTQPDGALISDGLYNALLGLVLMWGFALNWVMVKRIDPAVIQAVPFWVFLIGYFASCLVGVYLFNNSHQPAVSFAGYNMVVVPFGLIINLVVSRYDPRLVLEAVQVTAGVTLVMMTLGSFFPAFFQSIRRALTAALLAVIVVELVMIFLFKRSPPEIVDWIVVLIFCGYIGYDWGRANAIPKTVDNAVDSAAAIYMDIVNLFLRILRIMGRRRR